VATVHRLAAAPGAAVVEGSAEDGSAEDGSSEPVQEISADNGVSKQPVGDSTSPPGNGPTQ
jgi:hypothetical protein